MDNLRKIYDDEDCFLYDVVLCRFVIVECYPNDSMFNIILSLAKILYIDLLFSKDQGEVRAHKIILAAQSEYFKVMIL